MSIGLSGDPHYFNKSKEEKYFETLSMVYYSNEHILLVRRIRKAKTFKEAMKIYHKGLRRVPVVLSGEDFRALLTVEKQKIAIENLQKFLSRKKIPYPEE